MESNKTSNDLTNLNKVSAESQNLEENSNLPSTTDDVDVIKPNKALLGGLGAAGLAGGGYALYINSNDESSKLDLPDLEHSVKVEVDSSTDDKITVHVEVPLKNQPQINSLSEFEKAFADARTNGLSQFEWNGNLYHTKTKEEMDLLSEQNYHQPNNNKTHIGDMVVTDSGEDKTYELTDDNPRVAAQVFDKRPVADQETLSFTTTYGAIDSNNDGIIDNIAIDNNNDGKADAIALDENSDGIFDVYMMNSDNNGTIDLSTRDSNQDGLDINDTSEAVDYEIDMNDYIEIDPTDETANDFDILTNLF
jgi:hypothetical protein